LTGTSPRDEAWFKGLFITHYRRIWKLLTHRVGSRRDADELAAETFLVLWRFRARVPDDEDKVVAWLHRVARNKERHYWRKRGRRPLDLVDVTELDEPRLATPDIADEVAGRLDRRREVIDMRTAMARLKHSDRMLLQRYADGLTTDELATEFGIRPDAVLKRLSRARDRVRRLMRTNTPPQDPRQPTVQVRSY